MNKENTYFHIDFDQIGKKNHLFPYHIYVCHPISKLYTPYLFANSPLTPEKKSFLEMLINKGAEIAISMAQKNTFLLHEKLSEDDIESLKVPETHRMVLLQEARKARLEEKKKNGEVFHFKDQLTKAIELDNWMPIIDEARENLMSLSVTISHTVSLAIFFAENLLVEDNLTNRIVALSYHLAQSSKMTDDASIGDLCTASFLSHIGFTQLDYRFSQQPQINHYGSDKKEYRKHSPLSQHLIRKSGLLISDRCLQIINQHHERYDGSGFPDNRIGSYIEPLALVLGCSSHLLEYAEGKVTGEKVPWPVLINNLKNKTLSPGLELAFGDTLYQSIIHLLDSKVSNSKSETKGWNFATGKMVNMIDAGIIDPVKVTRCALQNGASVATALITSNHAIVET